jgi:hypothetical protein
MNIITKESISLLKQKNKEVTAHLKNLLNAFSVKDVSVGNSIVENPKYLAFLLEAYIKNDEEADLGIVLSIHFQEKNNTTEGEYSISKESGEFILSPRTFDIIEGRLLDEFYITLNEYYNVFELLLKNFILNPKDYINSYNKKW